MKNNNFVICETSNHCHPRYTQSICELLNKIEKNSVTLIIQSKQLSHYFFEDNTVKVIQVSDSIFEIKNILLSLKNNQKSTLFIFPTLEPFSVYNLKLLFFIGKYLNENKVVIGVHNGKYIFENNFKKLYYLYKESSNYFHLKKNLLALIDGIFGKNRWQNNNLHVMLISERLQKNIRSISKVKTIVIPTDFYSLKQIHNNLFDKSDLKIIIPGAVDVLRRDYIGFIEALKNTKINLSGLKIYLLGAFPQNDINLKIRKDLTDLKNKNIKIITYDDKFLDNDFFNSICEKGNFIFILRPTIPYGNYKESGGYSLINKFGIPGILHESDENINEASLVYESYDDLFLKISILDFEQYQFLLKQQLELSKNFTAEAIFKKYLEPITI